MEQQNNEISVNVDETAKRNLKNAEKCFVATMIIILSLIFLKINEFCFSISSPQYEIVLNALGISLVTNFSNLLETAALLALNFPLAAFCFYISSSRTTHDVPSAKLHIKFLIVLLAVAIIKCAACVATVVVLIKDDKLVLLITELMIFFFCDIPFWVGFGYLAAFCNSLRKPTEICNNPFSEESAKSTDK